jgi:ATP-dependent protease Clp ATPase subunit
VQLQKKRHAHEKEMQQQKLQHDKKLEQELDVVHQHLQDEDLLAEGLQVLLAERLQVLLAEGLQEERLEDLLHEEEDVNRLSLFFLF